MKIDHVGIAVKDLEKTIKIYEKILQKSPEKTENLASEELLVSFFKTETSKIELLQATSNNGPIAKFITKKGEGVHHIAFKVDDIYAEIERLKKEGFQMVNSLPKIGANKNLIAFLHPKTCNGVLIELCQTITS